MSDARVLPPTSAPGPRGVAAPRSESAQALLKTLRTAIESLCARGLGQLDEEALRADQAALAPLDRTYEVTVERTGGSMWPLKSTLTVRGGDKFLFEKRGPITKPTAIADDYYRPVALALSGLDDASRKVRRLGRDDIVTIGTYPGIATFWALPRLAAQSKAVSYRVVTAERDADLDLAEMDAAILFGDGDWPGFEAHRLIGEAVVPVAAPALAKALKARPPAEWLVAGPLIHLEDAEARWFTWTDWQKRFGGAWDALSRSQDELRKSNPVVTGEKIRKI